MPERSARVRAFRAPGRVNLIGDHTDYNEGFVLPVAIQLQCLVRASPRTDSSVVADSSEGDARSQRYVEGVIDALARRGRRPVGIDAEIVSTVPLGAGLSSSAAFEVALALALCDAASFDLSPMELALACQEAEQMATGVPCGIMDQLTSVGGRAGCALLIDCRSLEIDPIPIPESLSIIVVHSGLPRALAESPYAERRAACEAAAARLGLAALRDASAVRVEDDVRARHVVSENARVLQAAEALRDGDLDTLGLLLSASHASLRDDFEVSTPELDLLAVELERAGVFGARLTGAGFGGCVVALARREEAESVAAHAAERYRAAIGLEPTAFICTAVDGASSCNTG